MKNTLPAEKTTRSNADCFQESKRKPSNDELPQKENQNKHYHHKDKNHFFKINEQHRMEKLRGTIEAAPDGKPIRLYIKNMPSFANEYDFEDKCEGLLNVVWNQTYKDCCNILIVDKYKALDVLNLESSLPKYCKEGHIFVNRAEENFIKPGKKATPSRFENYHEMTNNRGFFIVENDIMKYYWYDQAGGFYDENGAYYNSSGKPQIPSYVLRAKQNNHQNSSNENKEKPSKISNTNENLDFNENNNKKQAKTEKNGNKIGNDSENKEQIQISDNKDSSYENSSMDSNTNNNTKQPKKKQPKEKKNLDSKKQLSVIEKDREIAQDHSPSPVIEYVNKDKETDVNKSNNNEKRNKQKARKNEKLKDSSTVINNQNGNDQSITNVVTEVKEIPLAKTETASNIPVKSENDEKTNKQQKEGRTQGSLLLKQIGLIRQQQERCRPQKPQGKENDIQENA